MKVRVAVIGRRDESRQSHGAIPRAIELAAGKDGARVEWFDARTLTASYAIRLAEFDAFWFAPGCSSADQEGLSHAASFARKNFKPALFTGDAALHSLADYARTGLKMRWRIPQLPEPVTQNVVADYHTPIELAYRKTAISAPALTAISLDPQVEERLFGPGQPFSIHARDSSARIAAFGHPRVLSMHVGVLFEPEIETLTGKIPPLARQLITIARIHLTNSPRQRRNFFLFDDSWCFFPQSPVRALMRKKIGSIHYQGGFSVLRRPAVWIPFLETDRLAAELERAVAPKQERSLSFAEFKQMEAKGNPVLLEFGLQNFAELARRSFSLSIEDYHNRIEVSMAPWTSGGRVGKTDWVRKIFVSRDAPYEERRRAFRRAALALQTQYPPSGYEFRPGKGLIKEV